MSESPAETLLTRFPLCARRAHYQCFVEPVSKDRVNGLRRRWAYHEADEVVTPRRSRSGCVWRQSSAGLRTSTAGRWARPPGPVTLMACWGSGPGGAPARDSPRRRRDGSAPYRERLVRMEHHHHPRAGGGQRWWTSRTVRTADSRAPSIQAALRLVCSPAKWIRPSTVRDAGCSSWSWPGVKMTASPRA